jgi:hypothetical protein
VADPIELYQLLGSALRDVAQARFVSDLFSRQISFQYEKDALLRRFPVPRVDIDEAELNLYFAVQSVEIDPNRGTTRNAAIGGLFHSYGIRIARDALDLLRKAAGSTLASDKAQFEKRILSDDHIEMLGGRVTQYLNENVDTLFDMGEFKRKKVDEYLSDKFLPSVFNEQQLSSFAQEDTREGWERAIRQARDAALVLWSTAVGDLAADIAKLRDKYPDYKILVAIDPEALRASGAAVSSIKIKGSVKNYKWSKVDIDRADMRNIRTLNVE